MSQDKKCIIFRLANEKYGVPIEQVISIENVAQITRVPNAPSYVTGVINLRGTIIPVVDLRIKFSMDGGSTGNDNERLIVVNIDSIQVALLVDEAKDVIQLPASKIETPPSIVGGLKAKDLSGVAKVENEILILLNLHEVLSRGEVEEVKAMNVD